MEASLHLAGTWLHVLVAYLFLTLPLTVRVMSVEIQKSSTLSVEGAKQGPPTVAAAAALLLLEEKSDKVSNSTQTDHSGSMEATEKPVLVTGLILAVAAACSSVLAIIVLIIVIIFAIRCYWDRPSKAPPYGTTYLTGNDRDFVPVFMDRKMAQSAQMFFYQYQKQQLIAQESEHKGHQSAESDSCSETETKDGRIPMVSCPGLAMESGEDLEVRNPMFSEDAPTWNGSVATDDEGSPPLGTYDSASPEERAEAGASSSSTPPSATSPPQLPPPPPQPPPSSPTQSEEADDVKTTDVNKNLTLRGTKVKSRDADDIP